MNTVRDPAVSGLFYPARAEELRAQISGLLDCWQPDTRISTGELEPKAFIVPHAGYVFSGRVAASAYRQIQHWWRCKIARGSKALELETLRVVILGPAHHAYIRGAVATSYDGFRTPLGVAKIDQTLQRKILEFPHTSTNNEAHAQEHCLEVQLPFLQEIIPSLEIVPLVVGKVAPEELKAIFLELINTENLLTIVSSDLSHYHPYNLAQELDNETAQAIMRKDNSLLNSELACGFAPIAGLLEAAKALELQVEKLALLNSGDESGRKREVVGYGSFMFY